MRQLHKALLAGVILMTSSCNDFLDLTPTDFVNPGNYYQTEEHLKAARNSVYSMLGETPLYRADALYMLGWEGDEGYMNRNSIVTGPHNYNFTSSDSYVSGFWRTLYNGINRANVLLENVDRNPELDERLRKEIRGETLFLRGYFHFLLVQYFGDVPLKTASSASVLSVHLARTPAREVYDQIVEDMTAAEEMVPDIREVGHSGRITKSAVRGILARVCLNMAGYPINDSSKWADARMWAKKVMDDGASGHALNPSFPQVFINHAADLYDIKESIWEAEFWGTLDGVVTKYGMQGFYNGPVNYYNLITGRSDAYINITAKLYNAYEPGDIRKHWTIQHFNYEMEGPNGAKTFKSEPVTEVEKYMIAPAKWRREYETALPKTVLGSDVLLMFAEAENELNGPTPAAVEAINLIRRRAWSTGIKSIRVVNGGRGYTAEPEVIFSGGSGSGAEAKAVVKDGIVTAIQLENDELAFYKYGNYSTAPVVTITGGGGSGAEAVATIFTREDAEVPATASGSKENLRAFIRAERMRELAFEGFRKTDLHRWGIFFEVMQDMANTINHDAPGAWYADNYGRVQSKHQYWPIPQEELIVNKAIIQNPGWE
jgi:hypothetical protein